MTTHLGRTVLLCGLFAACDSAPTLAPSAPDLAPADPLAKDCAADCDDDAPVPVAATPDVVGQQVADLGADHWLQGQAEVGGTQLVVFWELWCPHCRREAPRLQQLHETMGADGLGVVGLTRLTRGVTEDQVRGFLGEEKIAYPIGVGAEDLARQLQIKGIPAAAVLVEGEVVWRGHPARLDEATLRGWLPEG